MYQLIASGGVLRLADGAMIPADEGNADYQAYLAWRVEGNTPQPAAVVWPEAATPLKVKQAALVEARPASLQDEIFIDDTITIGEWQ